MRTLTVSLLATAALGGCATVPAPLAGNNFAAITPQQAVSADASGQHVRWGGEIINVEPRADVTCFEVLSRELYADARPSRHDHSDGRFMACSKGFYDPAVYTKGRDLTVVGSVSGTEQHKVGEFDYTFPQVSADQVYLWPKREYVNSYPFGYYDPFWGGYGWGGYGYWGGPWYGPPPVVIVRPHHH